MKKKTLNEIITLLFAAGFIVVEITFNMATDNTCLRTELNVAYDKQCYFKHPSDDTSKVFVFAYVPHLLKLTRNYFIDQGFCIFGQIENNSPLERLLIVLTTEPTNKKCYYTL